MDDDDYDDDSDVKMWLVLGGRQVPQLTSISAGTISISHITIITIIIIITVDRWQKYKSFTIFTDSAQCKRIAAEKSSPCLQMDRVMRSHQRALN